MSTGVASCAARALVGSAAAGSCDADLGDAEAAAAEVAASAETRSPVAAAVVLCATSSTVPGAEGPCTDMSAATPATAAAAVPCLSAVVVLPMLTVGDAAVEPFRRAGERVGGASSGTAGAPSTALGSEKASGKALLGWPEPCGGCNEADADTAVADVVVPVPAASVTTPNASANAISTRARLSDVGCAGWKAAAKAASTRDVLSVIGAGS